MFKFKKISKVDNNPERIGNIIYPFLKREIIYLILEFIYNIFRSNIYLLVSHICLLYRWNYIQIQYFCPDIFCAYI